MLVAEAVRHLFRRSLLHEDMRSHHLCRNALDFHSGRLGVALD